jgi:hypothetical protein
MGQQFLDQYSLLHFATGVLAYFWGISFLWSFILHTLFEWLENTQKGMDFINQSLGGIWPGGKPYADGMLNRVGDTVAFGIGWYISQQLDLVGIQRGWY